MSSQRFVDDRIRARFQQILGNRRFPILEAYMNRQRLIVVQEPDEEHIASHANSRQIYERYETWLIENFWNFDEFLTVLDDFFYEMLVQHPSDPTYVRYTQSSWFRLHQNVVATQEMVAEQQNLSGLSAQDPNIDPNLTSTENPTNEASQQQPNTRKRTRSQGPADDQDDDQEGQQRKKQHTETGSTVPAVLPTQRPLGTRKLRARPPTVNARAPETDPAPETDTATEESPKKRRGPKNKKGGTLKEQARRKTNAIAQKKHRQNKKDQEAARKLEALQVAAAETAAAPAQPLTQLPLQPVLPIDPALNQIAIDPALLHLQPAALLPQAPVTQPPTDDDSSLGMSLYDIGLLMAHNAAPQGPIIPQGFTLQPAPSPNPINPPSSDQGNAAVSAAQAGPSSRGGHNSRSQPNKRGRRGQR